MKAPIPQGACKVVVRGGWVCVYPSDKNLELEEWLSRYCRGTEYDPARKRYIVPGRFVDAVKHIAVLTCERVEWEEHDESGTLYEDVLVGKTEYQVGLFEGGDWS